MGLVLVQVGMQVVAPTDKAFEFALNELGLLIYNGIDVGEIGKTSSYSRSLTTFVYLKLSIPSLVRSCRLRSCRGFLPCAFLPSCEFLPCVPAVVCSCRVFLPIEII